ncbi:hypothetical protein [Burkholderia gladioli]|uniref:hypothetical protein n=1 Tax=Burkholderia gladioli TaxID=28095 RepID=UPI0016403B57|nr:hypothetical protein [Burkholderia gladioli]
MPAIDPVLLSEIKKGNLYALLEVCTDDDLEPLVDLLKGPWSSSLTSDAQYKRFPSHPSRYSVAIGDEIRAFGGNTVKNQLRGGGPDYGEVVIDVCKRLGVPYKDNSIIENESALLHLLFAQDWNTLDAIGRKRAIAQARTMAASEATKVKNVVKENVKRSLAGGVLAFNPLTAVAALGSMAVTEPAYRITAPCVLHVAYLRRKTLDATMEPMSERVTSVVALRDVERSAALTVQEEGGGALVSLTRISHPDVEHWHEAGAADEGISRLSPLFQAVPSLMTAQHVASTKYMEVVINGPLLKAKNGVEGYRLTTNIGGKLSNGTLLDPSTLSNIVNAGALLQVASFALGQKHLADIKRELNEIKISVKRIEEFQQNERLSKLTGMLDYLEQIAPVIMAGEGTAHDLAQLESHEPTLLSIRNHLFTDIETQTAAILDVRDPDTFGSEGAAKAIADHHKRLATHFEQALLCLRVRAANLQLASCAGLNEHKRQARIHDIRQSLDELRQEGPYLVNADVVMRKKIQTLSALTNSRETLTRRKFELLQLPSELAASVKSWRTAIDQDLESVDEFFKCQEEPTRVLLKLDGERVMGMHVV